MRKKLKKNCKNSHVIVYACKQLVHRHSREMSKLYTTLSYEKYDIYEEIE